LQSVVKLYSIVTVANSFYEQLFLFFRLHLTVGGMNRRGFKPASQSTVTKTTKKLRTTQTSETPMVYVPPVGYSAILPIIKYQSGKCKNVY